MTRTGDNEPPRVRNTGAMTGEELFLANLGLIDEVIGHACRRHGLGRDEAEEQAAMVRLALIDDDYRVLRAFDGRSKLRTYLAVVVHRLLVDHKVRRWGKWRPSAVARREGPVAVRLEELLYRHGHSFAEACRIVLDDPAVKVSQAQLEAVAGRLPPRTRRRFEGQEALQEIAQGGATPEERALERERDELLAAANQVLDAARSALPAEDRLILKLRFEQGMSVAAIARLLGLELKPMYPRLERLLRDLRAAAEAAGVDREVARAILREPT